MKKLSTASSLISACVGNGSRIEPIPSSTVDSLALLMISVGSFQLVIGEHDVAAHDEFEQIRGIKKVIIEPDFSTRFVVRPPDNQCAYK